MSKLSKHIMTGEQRVPYMTPYFWEEPYDLPQWSVKYTVGARFQIEVIGESRFKNTLVEDAKRDILDSVFGEFRDHIRAIKNEIAVGNCYGAMDAMIKLEAEMFDY